MDLLSNLALGFSVAISVQNNLVHGSDAPENAAAEIALWFKPEELLTYAMADATWIAGV